MGSRKKRKDKSHQCWALREHSIPNLHIWDLGFGGMAEFELFRNRRDEEEFAQQWPTLEGKFAPGASLLLLFVFLFVGPPVIACSWHRLGSGRPGP